MEKREERGEEENRRDEGERNQTRVKGKKRISKGEINKRGRGEDERE